MLRSFNGDLISAEDERRFREFVRTHSWRFAWTYAKFCPHEYTLLKKDLFGDFEDFEWFARFVWKNGFYAKYGKHQRNKYFIDEEEGMYYFVFPEDLDENLNGTSELYLLNRGHLDRWEFIEEETLFGTEWIVRTKKKPKPPDTEGEKQ